MKAQTLALLANQTASPDTVYGQALDAVFNFVGSFTPEALKPLVETYPR